MKRIMIKPKHDLLLVFIASWVVFWIQSIAWPLGPGRDALGYLAYYFDFGKSHPFDEFFMLLRTPLPSFVFTPLLLKFGSLFVEFLLSLTFATGLLLCFKVGLLWSRKVATLFWLLLLVQFGYGSLYHVVSSDSLNSFFVAVFFFFIFWGTKNKKIYFYFLSGIVAGLLFLIRPSNQLLIFFFLVPFLVKNSSFKSRAMCSGVFLAGILPILFSWAAWNYKMTGVFTLSRTTYLLNPIWRVWIADQTISPDNGPQSKKLAQAIDERLKPKEGSRAYMASPNYNIKIGELGKLVDDAWGKDSNYKIVKDVAVEAIVANPQKYILGVLQIYLQTLALNYKHPVPLKGGAFVHTHKGRVAYVGDDQKDHFDLLGDVDLSKVKNSPLYEESLQKNNPTLAKAFQIQKTMLPERSGNIAWGKWMNRLAQVYPPCLFWIFCFFVGLLFKSKLGNYELILGFFVLFSLAHLLVGCLTIHVAVYQYRLYFEPVFILAGLTGILNIAAGRKKL